MSVCIVGHAKDHAQKDVRYLACIDKNVNTNIYYIHMLAFPVWCTEEPKF